MKTLFVALALSVSTAALADSLVCELTVGNEYRSGHEQAYRSRQVKVLLGDYACDGSMSNGEITTIMYQPILHNDQDILRETGSAAQGAGVANEDAQCYCSLM